jgi:hypothetical protein
MDKSRQEVNFEERDEMWLKIKKIPVAKKSKPQVLGPICGTIQSVRKEISRHLQIKTIGKP